MYTNTLIQIAKRMYEDGVHVDTIAKHLGISRVYVYTLLKKTPVTSTKKERHIGRIKQLREAGKTYQQIADILKITRQRVHQIYNDGDRKKYNTKKVVIVCAFCEKHKEVSPSQKKRKYCNNSCWRDHQKAKKKSPEELREYHRKRYRDWWNSLTIEEKRLKRRRKV